MAVVDRSVIADLPLFRGLGPSELDEILVGTWPARFPKGPNVFEQGQDAEWFFVLLHGSLRVVKFTQAGHQVLVRYVVPGEIFGIAKAIGRTTYPATAMAVVDSLALVWPSAAWPGLIARFPALALAAMETIGSRLEDAYARVVEMSTEEVERRVAHALVRLAHQAGCPCENGIKINFPITRQDVAEMTGTTLHTVSRILSAWDEQGLVESGRQKIVICDPERLFLLAERPAE